MVYKLFIQAHEELQRVYRPFQAHPLHAAVVGETPPINLARGAELLIGPGHDGTWKR